MKLFKLLPKNTHGRDFVVGDLHGCFDQLTMFMRFIRFDPEVDRLFSVGDLVDRGPKNLECLRLLNKPWFHAVKGNHEELMQDFLLGGPTGPWWSRNGGKWFDSLSTSEAKELVALVQDKVVDLPLMLSVVDQFHVLHAELDAVEELTDDDLADLDTFKEVALAQCMDGASILWGRNIFLDLAFKGRKQIVDHDIEFLKKSSFTKMFGPKLSQIFSGHTPVQNPTKILGQINLDTGAFLTGSRPWAGLTFAEPASGKFWKVTDDVNPAELTVIL